MSEVRVGVVGYCPPSRFDEELARSAIVNGFDRMLKHFNVSELTIVSGATNVGVLAIAYAEAAKRGWKTVGVACMKARDFQLFPTDELKLIGENWGDESSTFVSMLDGIIKIGGGKQSAREFEEVLSSGKPGMSYEVPLITEPA